MKRIVELSTPVRAAIDGALEIVQSLVLKIIEEGVENHETHPPIGNLGRGGGSHREAVA